MFEHLGLQIEKIANKDIISSSDIDLLIKLLNGFCRKISLISDNKIEFGRYLAYQSNNFNIQVDVFSSNYMGQIHNHGTWGMLGIVHGDFIIRDYITNYDKLSQVNTTIGSKGLVTYFPKAYDVHAVESLSGPQGITIHVYGKEFNMDTGMKFENANNNWQSYKRGKLREFIEIEFNFRIKGT